MTKEIRRARRSGKTKMRQRKLSSRPRLVVYRSNGHMYAQVSKACVGGDVVIVSCSTLEKELRSQTANKVDQAKMVGKLIGERAIANNVKEVAFDRNGYKYHGRVQALADAAREAGLDF